MSAEGEDWRATDGRMIRFAVITVCIALAVGMIAKPGDWTASPAPKAADTAVVEASPAQTSSTMADGSMRTELRRDPDGHFYAEVKVNSVPIRFLIDTGASMVALTKEDAQRAGLAFSEDEFTGQAKTASGTVGLKPVLLDQVALGPLEATKVEGAIIQQGLSQSLLGQSWLKQVGSVTIEGDRMILR